MTCVIDLASRRRASMPVAAINHPSGVQLPLDDDCAPELVPPELRTAISEGAYAAEMIARLPDALRAGDRVLLIGAGLGVLSTLIARSHGVDQLIAIEADLRLMPYLERVHARNGVPWVQTLNAVPANGRRGRVPFFARRDLRTSSLQPHESAWQQVMMVPLVDLGLILADEQISLLVWDIPATAPQFLAEMDLGPVERVLINGDNDPSQQFRKSKTGTSLGRQGFTTRDDTGAILLQRSERGTRSDLQSATCYGNLCLARANVRPSGGDGR